MATLQNPTLSRLIIEVRNMLNQPSASNSFWTDAELTGYLNDAVAMYFHEVSERSEGQFEKVVDLDVVANTETIDLPTDFFEMKTLFRKTNGTYFILTYRNNLTENYTTEPTSNSSTWLPTYYFRDNQIVVHPQPDFNETAALRMEYTYLPDTMVYGGDTLSAGISPIFKELIVLYAVYKAKVKESLTIGNVTYTAVQQLLDATYIRFKDTVGLRSKNPTFVLPFNP